MKLFILSLFLLIPVNAHAVAKIINADIAASGTANIALNKLAASTAHNAATFDASGFLAGGVAPGSSGNYFRSNGTDWLGATPGNLTDAGTDGITVTGGTGSVFGAGTSLAQHVADGSFNGYLSSTDWTAFSAKQPAGNYITALTGDVTASGPGSAVSTLATVNGNVGSFTYGSFTVNGKGLITAASSGATPEVPLTFSTGLTRTVNTITVNTSQNISTLSNLTTNGFVRTSGGTGALGVQTDPCSVAEGCTGLATLTAHALYVGNGASAPNAVSVGATNTVLHGNTGADPTFSAIVNADITNSTIDLTTKVTGVLPVGNGGTGQSSNWTQYGVIYASTTGVQASTAAGTAGYPLISNNSSAPTYQQLNLAGAGVTGILPVANTTVANNALTTCTTARTIDFSTGRSFTLTLTSGNACTLTFSNAVSGQTITLWLTNDSASSGTATVVWPSMKWKGGAPVMTTGASKLDVCTVTYNGTSYAGSCIQDMQ